MPYRSPGYTHVQTIGMAHWLLNKCAVCYIHSDCLHSKPQEPSVQHKLKCKQSFLCTVTSQCLWGGWILPCASVRYCELAPLGPLPFQICACSAQQLKSHTGIFSSTIISYWRDIDHVTDLEVFLKHSHLSLEGFEPPPFPLKWESLFSHGS